MTDRPDVPRAYDRIAEKFFATRQTSLEREKKYLQRLLERLPAGARILDFGCGTGRPIGEDLLARGFGVTGVDGSAGMLAIARRNLPGARLVQARMEDVELDETFSAAVAWDSLFHVPREDHEAIYRKFARWIEPGGRLLLTTGGEADAGFTGTMHGEVFFYSSWRPEKVVALLEGCGFVVELCEVDDPTPRGHVVIVARKADGRA